MTGEGLKSRSEDNSHDRGHRHGETRRPGTYLITPHSSENEHTQGARRHPWGSRQTQMTAHSDASSTLRKAIEADGLHTACVTWAGGTGVHDIGQDGTEP